MPDLHSLETVLRHIHQKSKSDQSALYFFSYPDYSNLLLCSTIGAHLQNERYWRSHCGDKKITKSILESKHPIFLQGKPITGRMEQILAVPILYGESTIGVVVHCYIDQVCRSWEELQHSVNRRAEDFFAGWIEFLIAEQSRPLPALLDIAGSISSSLDLDRVLLNVVEKATVLFRGKMSSLMLVNHKTDELELVTAYGCSLEYLNKPNLPIHSSILGTVVKHNQIVQIFNVHKEPQYLHKYYAEREGVVSLMAAPIAFQNEVLGVLNIYSATLRKWQQSEKELLKTFADHAAIAITNARVHEQNMAMEEQLQVSSKLASLGELAAGLAHEIRNPLAVINMLIHSWKTSPPTEEDFRHDVEVISQKISDLNTLVTDLLNLARSRPLDRQPYDIELLIDRVLRLLRHRITQQKVTVKKNVLTDRTVVPIDRERIEQAILNLLLNALDFTPQGKQIVIHIRTCDNNLALDIEDSGPGISPDHLHSLFKTFRSNKAHGTGLGLPTSRRIVEEHKGMIELTGNSTEGATFTIFLPYTTPD